MFWKGRKRQEKGKKIFPAMRQKVTLPRNYPETTQKLPGNKTLILHLSRKELSISCYFIHMQDVKKSHLTWAHCQKMG